MLHAAGPAAEGRVIGVRHRVSLDDRPVDECGVDEAHNHIDNSGVIGEAPTAPLAAGKTDAQVAAAVVDAAVVANVGAPVALVVSIAAIRPAPISGGFIN